MDALPWLRGPDGASKIHFAALDREPVSRRNLEIDRRKRTPNARSCSTDVLAATGICGVQARSHIVVTVSQFLLARFLARWSTPHESLENCVLSISPVFD